MSIERAICSHLRNESSITVLVGTKTYQNRTARNASLPYIVVSRVSANRPRHLRAGVAAVNPRVQVACYADDPNEAHDIAEAVRLVLHGLRDDSIGNDGNRLFVNWAVLDDEVDLYDFPTDGSNVGADSVRQTWSIWHSETVPTFV